MNNKIQSKQFIRSQMFFFELSLISICGSLNEHMQKTWHFWGKTPAFLKLSSDVLLCFTDTD